MNIIEALPIFEKEKSISNLSQINPLQTINIDAFWKQNIKGKEITIAILDSGCSSNHPDIKNRIIGGANFTEEDNGNFDVFEDYNGHGTHVAGIVSSNNLNKITSVAPEANLFIGKVLDKHGRGSIGNLINAIYYSINWRGKNGEKVRIMCLSLGTQENNVELHKAIQFANMVGIPVVAASGNDGVGNVEDIRVLYPGAYNEVIQVGAIDEHFNIASFSNVNDYIDLLAPGVNINSTYINNDYKTMSGTSMAAPFVAGALALIMQKIEREIGRELSESEIYAQLIKRTKKLKHSFKIEGNGLLFLK